MKIFFNKYKYTHQIFYSSLSGASIEISTGTIVLNIPIMPQLNGIFYIRGTFRKTESKTTYEIYKMGYSEILLIDIHNDYKKISVFNQKLEGIILKV
jgi:hypothetical protein